MPEMEETIWPSKAMNQNTVTREECEIVAQDRTQPIRARLARAHLELLTKLGEVTFERDDASQSCDAMQAERDELRSQKAALESQLADTHKQLDEAAELFVKKVIELGHAKSQLAEATASIGTILIERETAKEQLAEARKMTDHLWACADNEDCDYCVEIRLDIFNRRAIDAAKPEAGAPDQRRV